jgi:multiple sugar transport system substrate-binding protein
LSIKYVRLMAVATVMAVLAACGGETGGETTTTGPGTTAATTTAAPTETTAGAATGPLEMWERTGGNAPMVDALVEAWNEANPDRQINLTYIDHVEMVPKLAQAIASGEVPDLMGLDLIYGPQFSSAGQLEDITDYFADDPLVATAVQGHMDVATWEDRLYGVPLYADVSALFWNKDLFRQAGLDPETPPTSLAELHDMAAAINDPANGVYGYYLPGNCAGCNIFTFAPMIWASGGKIEPAAPGDEALVPAESITPVLEWARMMHQEGLIDPAAQAETGATFGEVFGSGRVGIMGTGNFNITLVTGAEGIEGQNPDMDFGITVIPGLEPGLSSSFAGGDIVTVPKGSQRVEDAVDFMKFILSDEVQVEVYAKLLNMTTRSDMADNQYFAENQHVQDVAQAIEVAQTPFTVKFFELINSPQGPWLQMLQRVYYTEEPIDQIVAEAKADMERIINE